MNLEENNEQPPATSKPPSDFNDLHVLAGLGEVRRQIETAISSSDFASAVSPNPFDLSDQNLGQISENQSNIGYSDQEFSLDFAPPMNGHSETGEQLETGSGEDFRVLDPNSPAAKLKNALERYAVIACSNDAFDLKTKHKFKISSLKHTLSSIYKNWYSHEDRKTLEKDEVEKMLIDGAGDIAPTMSKNCILLKGETFLYDKSLNRVVSWSAAQLMYPHEYKKWIESPQRSEIDYEKLIFDPTRKIDIDPNYINTFEGYGVKQLLDDHDNPLDRVSLLSRCGGILKMTWCLCNGDLDIQRWLLQWLAYPLQNEGQKAHSAVLMASHIQGSGKTTLFEKVMGGIYGKYHRVITSQELESPQFNGWLNNAAFIFGEEIATNATKYNVTPYLNALITAKSVTINEKQRPQKQVPAYFNMAFASNENIPFPLHGEARRWFVIAPESKLDEGLSERVYAEIASDGLDAFYSYLLSIPLDDFKHDKPPLTEAKRALMNASKRSIEVFVDEWIAGETKYKCTSCMAKQLYDAYKEWASSTLEHKYSYRKFTEDLKKIDGIELLEKQKWRDKREKFKENQSLIIKIGEVPLGMTAIDWYGECVNDFENGVPNVLDKNSA
ncbi:primase-helicase family protein [Acinetobacter junii]|uniref:primase-helicase family protein n=1 Tax=Acinetobacter junii TaxID=40215 RepID=UPI0032B53CF7